MCGNQLLCLYEFMNFVWIYVWINVWIFKLCKSAACMTIPSTLLDLLVSWTDQTRMWYVSDKGNEMWYIKIINSKLCSCRSEITALYVISDHHIEFTVIFTIGFIHSYHFIIVLMWLSLRKLGMWAHCFIRFCSCFTLHFIMLWQWTIHGLLTIYLALSSKSQNENAKIHCWNIIHYVTQCILCLTCPIIAEPVTNMM